MLAELRIRNFAIIDQVALEFGPGLNVLSGETGAGKTIIMNALGLLLGMRASPEMVRAEQKEAQVQARFEFETGHGLCDQGLELEADQDELLVQRAVSEAGRSRVLINERMATVQALARVGAELVQVYGQHEQQSLLRAENHLLILDRYLSLEGVAAEYRAAYERARKVAAELAALAARAAERERRLELARFELAELERAALSPDEEQALVAERVILSNATKLAATVSAVEELLMAQDAAAVDLVGRAQSQLNDAAVLDPKLGESLELVAAARLGLEEAAHRLRLYAQRIEAEPARLEQLEQRLQEIARLKRKYGGSVESALAALERAAAEVSQLENADQTVAELQADFARAIAQAVELARQLSEARTAGARKLKAAMEAELKTLGMARAVFAVSLTPLAHAGTGLDHEGLALGPDGAEQAEFQIAPNLGHPPMALAKIASGGELSRIMLALKRLEAQRRGVATMVFDEVDAGIGGAVAEVVGRKLKELARYHQILCITHLPQIASFADRHFLVEKEEHHGLTVSRVTALAEPQRVEELARMLGGTVSEQFRRAARELLARAHKA